jgi:pimeloyl-ACP methyl ester carboxylesterase
MKLNMRLMTAALPAALLCLGAGGVPAAVAPINNIVLVHGAWVDGSGWRPVYDILVKDGYHVTMVQEPLTSLADDVAATKRVVALQAGLCILVSHSYGGTIITEAGNDPKVAGLVYVASHEPDQGEDQASNGARYPSALSEANAIEKTPDGFTYIDPGRFPELFAADLPRDQAVFEANAQIMTAAKIFSTAVTTAAAWRTRPSWALIAGADKVINPDLERMYANRAHSHMVEVPGASHSVYTVHPKEVAALIEEAATHAGD